MFFVPLEMIYLFKTAAENQKTNYYLQQKYEIRFISAPAMNLFQVKNISRLSNAYSHYDEIYFD